MNKENFEDLTTEEQAVAVAKDVIKQIKLKRFKVSPGTYVSFRNSNVADKVDMEEVVDNDGELCELIPNMKNCEVCARGAMFMSHINLADDYSIGNFYINSSWNSNTEFTAGGEQVAQRLDDVFGKRLQAQIEAAFEKEDVNDGLYDFYHDMVNDADLADELFKRELNECLAFGRRFTNHTNRLIAIMQNIIKNKGKFVPTK